MAKHDALKGEMNKQIRHRDEEAKEASYKLCSVFITCYCYYDVVVKLMKINEVGLHVAGFSLPVSPDDG